MAQEARLSLEDRHRTREAVLAQSRKLIQTCSKCIKHVHRRQMEEAEKLLSEAGETAAAMRSLAADQPEVLYAGYIQDAEKEMVEAAALIALISGSPIPGSYELDCGVTSWLHGMGEAASELRRYVLDEMRAGNLDEASRLMRLMEGIYDELTTFDFPDGLTGGLRRTCDALRAVIERTRSDLTMTHIQNELIRELKASRPYEK
jgi:translin